MARRRRLQYPGAFYHVYSRGNRKGPIFLDEADYRLFEEHLNETAERCQVLLVNWCLMPNHFHILVETPRANLADFMRCLLTRYAMLFNRRHNLVGHVFQSRYQANVCFRESYFHTLIGYIHLNPIRSKKGKKPLVRRLEDWPWSSHRYYLSGGGPASVRKFVKAFFGDKYDENGHNVAYKAFIAERIKNEKKDPTDPINGKPILGGDAFIEEVKKKTNQPVRMHDRRHKKLKGPWGLVKHACQRWKISPSELREKNQHEKLSWLRQVIAYVGRRYFRFKAKDIGTCLGRSGPAISQILRRNEDRLAECTETQELLKYLTVKEDSNQVDGGKKTP